MNESQDNPSPPSDPSNPYLPPGTPSGGATGTPAGLIAGGRRVSAGNAGSWFGCGWGLFKETPGMWILLTLIYFILAVIINVIPLGSIAFYLISPVLLAGLMLGCESLAHNNELELSHLFAGFERNAGPLLLVGLLYLIGVAAVFMIAAILFMLIAGGATLTHLFRGGELDQIGDMLTAGGVAVSILLGFLIFFALLIPLMMAYWFAPALVVFHKLEPIDAMKMSFTGCWKNLGPFLLYGLLGMILAIAASIPLLLGWFIVWPMFIGSVYAAYRDIFVGDMEQMAGQ